MSTYYLLPNRKEVSARFQHFLESLLPGMTWDEETSLADVIEDLAETQQDVFVIYREDLPADEDVQSILRDWYGAEDDDVVIQVPDAETPAAAPQQWRIAA